MSTKPFIHTAITGMFDEQWVDDNCSCLTRHRKMRPEEKAALDAAREAARQFGARWLPGGGYETLRAGVWG